MDETKGKRSLSDAAKNVVLGLSWHASNYVIGGTRLGGY
jgi:hypothetical protein